MCDEAEWSYSCHKTAFITCVKFTDIEGFFIVNPCSFSARSYVNGRLITALGTTQLQSSFLSRKAENTTQISKNRAHRHLIKKRTAVPARKSTVIKGKESLSGLVEHKIYTRLLVLLILMPHLEDHITPSKQNTGAEPISLHLFTGHFLHADSGTSQKGAASQANGTLCFCLCELAFCQAQTYFF